MYPTKNDSFNYPLTKLMEKNINYSDVYQKVYGIDANGLHSARILQLNNPIMELKTRDIAGLANILSEKSINVINILKDKPYLSYLEEITSESNFVTKVFKDNGFEYSNTINTKLFNEIVSPDYGKLTRIFNEELSDNIRRFIEEDSDKKIYVDEYNSLKSFSHANKNKFTLIFRVDNKTKEIDVLAVFIKEGQEKDACAIYFNGFDINTHTMVEVCTMYFIH